jgi:phosphoglycerate-specific signal transduction histidine kinase
VDPRDPDLEAVFLHADAVTAVGVQALIDRLQSYRTLLREVSDHIDAQLQLAETTTSVYRLKDCIQSINARCQNLQWQLDIDFVALADLTDGSDA